MVLFAAVMFWISIRDGLQIVRDLDSWLGLLQSSAWQTRIHALLKTPGFVVGLLGFYFGHGFLHGRARSRRPFLCCLTFRGFLGVFSLPYYVSQHQSRFVLQTTILSAIFLAIPFLASVAFYTNSRIESLLFRDESRLDETSKPKRVHLR